MPDTLDHLEKTLADSYRKEIDQEETVWRTLPFFVAALALEIAELTQIKDQLARLSSRPFFAVVALGAIAFLAAATGVVFLLFSVWPRRFKYIASESFLLAYVEDLLQQEMTDGLSPGHATIELKLMLARQYAVTTESNRQINQGRVLLRSIAGAMTIVSVLASLAIGAVTVSNQLRLGSNGESNATTTGRSAKVTTAYRPS